MPTASDITPQTVGTEPTVSRRLLRSNKDRMLAGVAGGLAEYFEVDTVWFRIAFVLLALGGGSGILIYLIMWVVVPERTDDGTEPAAGVGRRISGGMVIGAVFILVGTVALVDTLAPDLGRYFWPIVFVIGGLALVIGGLNHDRSR